MITMSNMQNETKVEKIAQSMVAGIVESNGGLAVKKELEPVVEALG